MMKKDRKTKEYLKLHFKMVPWYAWIIMVLAGAGAAFTGKKMTFPDSTVFLELQLTGIMVTAAVACIFIFPAIDRICSVTLYQDQAGFYRSLPVTDAVTVGAKTIVTGLLTGLFPAGWFTAEFILSGERNVTVFFLLLLIACSAGMFLGGVILTGYKIGNNFRSMQKRKPNKVVAGIFILLIAGYTVFLLVKLPDLETREPEVKLLLVFLLSAAASLLVYAGNVYSVKHSYEA